MSNFIKNLRIFYTIEIPIVSEKIAYYRWYHRIGKKSPIAHPWRKHDMSGHATDSKSTRNKTVPSVT